MFALTPIKLSLARHHHPPWAAKGQASGTSGGLGGGWTRSDWPIVLARDDIAESTPPPLLLSHGPGHEGGGSFFPQSSQRIPSPLLSSRRNEKRKKKKIGAHGGKFRWDEAAAVKKVNGFLIRPPVVIISTWKQTGRPGDPE